MLEQCEIHPIRTEFIKALGEGAFGKVHKATLKNALDFFKSSEDLVGKARWQKIVAVKELHGEYDSFILCTLVLINVILTWVNDNYF